MVTEETISKGSEFHISTIRAENAYLLVFKRASGLKRVNG